MRQRIRLRKKGNGFPGAVAQERRGIMATLRNWGRDRIPGAGRRFASFVSGFLYLLLCLLLQTCLLCQCAFPLYAWDAEGKAGSAETAASRTELLKDYNEYEKRFQELETLEIGRAHV